MIVILPAITLLLGGAMASQFQPSRRLRGTVAHLVGGLVLGTAATDLMPAASAAGHTLWLGLGFCAGFSLMLVLNAFLSESNDHAKGALLLFWLPFLVDSMIDGLVVGISSSTGEKSWIIPVAIALEMGFSALGVGALLRRYHPSVVAQLTGALMAAAYLLGLASFQLLQGWLEGPALTGLLAFGTAALIYLVVEEVMKEAHAKGEDDSGLVNVSFFVGVLVVWLLETAQG